MPFLIVTARPFAFTEPVLSRIRSFPFLFTSFRVRVRMTGGEGFRVRVIKGASLRAEHMASPMRLLPLRKQGQACFGPRNDNSLCNSGLFWLSLRDPSRALTLRVTEWVSLRPFLLSLRAEHMTISGKPKLKNQRVK